MPSRICLPWKPQPIHVLQETSKQASVWYCRCERYGHVWTVNKWDPGALIEHVTISPIQ